MSTGFDIFLPDSSNPLVGLTGHTFGAGEATVRLPGSLVFGAADTARWVEIGYGIYRYPLLDAEQVTPGTAYIHVTVTGAQPYNGNVEVGSGVGSGSVPTVPSSRIITLAELRTRLYAKGGVEGSEDLTLAVIDPYINEAIAELWDELKKKRDDRLVVSTALATVAATSSVTLPAAFYELRKLELADPTVPSGVRKLMQGSLDAQHLYVINRSARYRYRIQGGQLFLMPPPQQVEALTLYYIPFAPKLILATDAIDGYNGYEEVIVQLAWRRCLERQELDTSTCEREVARLFARIAQAADGRDVEPFYLDPRGPTNPDGEGWSY